MTKFGKVRQFVGYTRKFLESDLDSVIACTSSKGMGKSSFGLTYAEEYVRRYCGEERFGEREIRKYFAFSLDDIWERADGERQLPDFSPIVADEALFFAMGEDWARWENKQIKKLFATMRTRHLSIVLNLPRFRWLDSKYRNDLISMWVRILKRGHAVIFQPNMSEVEDAYHLKDMQKLMGNIFYFTDTDKVVRRLRRHPCFFDEMCLPKPNDAVYKAYLRVRKDALSNQRSVLEDYKMSHKFAVWNLVKRWDEFMKGVAESKMKRPTYELISRELYRNPLTEKSAVAFKTVAMWVDDVEKNVGRVSKVRGVGKSAEVLPADALSADTNNL